MKFIKLINEKKFPLICLSLFLYVMINLFDGERGLISYYEKQKILASIKNDKMILEKKLALMKKKNGLLTNNIDLDYLETLYRNKLMVGKSNEKIFIND